MKKRIFGVLVILVLVVASVVSGKGENSVIDESGRRIDVTKPFRRIISLYGGHTENLFSLGLDREIIGVSENEAYPPQAMTKPIFSYHDDAEKFIAARPDLVLIRPMIARGYKDLISKLQKAGITVVSLQPTTVAEMYRYWENLGRLTGKEKEASRMIKRFKADLAKTNSIVKRIPISRRKRVYFEAIHTRMKTFSPSSIAIFALKTAGGINVANDAKAVEETNIAEYGKERILSRGNEIDVYLAQKGTMNRPTVKTIAEEAGFKAIKAVRNGGIYIIDEKIVSRSTLRLLDGIHEIGRILYPEKFNDVSELKTEAILSRAKFAEMFIKIMNIPLKTPDYSHDILKRADSKHKYGEFKDVDYYADDYKFIETYIYKGLFYDIPKYEFRPSIPIKRADVAFAIFMHFDLPSTKPIAIKDIKDTHPLFHQIERVISLNIMELDREGRFLPDKEVSGDEAYRIILKATRVSGEQTLRRKVLDENNP
jgi:iron complex transport system substrate-binding protein